MSLPQRDEDWIEDYLRNNFIANPLQDRPDDDYLPDTITKVRPLNPLQGQIDDLYAENAELDARCKQIAAERDAALRDKEDLTEECARVVKLSLDRDDERVKAIEDAGKITDLLNHEKTQTANLAGERRTLKQRIGTLERSRWWWRLAALAGWAPWLVALVRR